MRVATVHLLACPFAPTAIRQIPSACAPPYPVCYIRQLADKPAAGPAEGADRVSGGGFIRNTTFTNNSALPATSSGGAIFDWASDGLTLDNCTFFNNTVSRFSLIWVHPDNDINVSPLHTCNRGPPLVSHWKTHLLNGNLSRWSDSHGWHL